MLNNPHDPLNNTIVGNSSEEQQVFSKVVNCCTGLPVEKVVGIGINLIVNAIRQSHLQKNAAEILMSEVFGRAMQILLNHYDSVTGKRLNVFPFTQTIQAAPVVRGKPN